MGFIEIEKLCMHYENQRRFRRNDEDGGWSFGSHIHVLNQINIKMDYGEMVCILGPSGCGKSTLLRIIAGFENPSSGAVYINKKPVTGPSSDFIFVFQQNGLFPWMTIKENVALGLRHMRDEREKTDKIKEYVEIVELEGFEHHYPHQLSGGMQRRAELARALAVNPEMLIMDEPFSGLDFLTHMKMREEVVNMHEFLHKTVVLVTHDINDALIMGDRIIVLSGRPASVKLNRKISFPRPRDFEQNQELSLLRNQLFLMLGVAYAV